jgi:arylsulfatase A-like enzyme
MKLIKSRIGLANYSWKSLFEASFFCAYLYAFLEWLFIVTKPSFFSAVSLIQKIRILLFSGSLLVGITFLGMALLFGLACLLRGEWVQALLRNLGAFILAMIIAALGLLLVDNFTYTIFKFGIISTQGWSTFLYLIGFLLLLLYSFLEIKKSLSSFDGWIAKQKMRRLLDLALILVLVASFAFNYERPETNGQEFSAGAQVKSENYPNILLITADGLNAINTSAYGYERDTTPRIKALAEHSLVAENAFNNSGNTMGSVISMYTGKYPTETRTLYAPDILKGKDSYQHFPNILKQIGYYNIQYTYPHHADAYVRNVLAGFDEANGKTLQQNVVLNELNKYLKTDYAYFQYELGNRIVDRMRHIFFNKRMISQEELLFGTTQNFHDQDKIEKIFQVFKTSDQPVFAHLHWMGTHGVKFLPTQRTFSKGKDINNQPNWDVDFYDDSIIDFDAGVGQIIDRLSAMGIYQNTILIISSDHGQNYITNKRIPMIIHFPGDRYQQTIQSDVQILDIAPTLLAYLQVEKPVWMEGTSLLNGEPGDRPILGVGVGKNVRVEDREMVAADIKPPFYQFGFVSVVYRGNWYRLDLGDYHWEEGQVVGYTGAATTFLDGATVLSWMRERFKKDGFDTTSLMQFSKISKK